MEIIGFPMTKEELNNAGSELVAKMDEAIDTEDRTAVGFILDWDEAHVVERVFARFHKDDDPRYRDYGRWDDNPPRKGLRLVGVWRGVNVWTTTDMNRSDSEEVVGDC